MACILLWSSAVRVHDSQAYRKMDVTRERISRILELRETLLSIQIGFSLVNAAVACAILKSISGLEPSSVITKPSYHFPFRGFYHLLPHPSPLTTTDCQSPRSGELRTQKLKSHLVRTQSLNVLALKPGVGQYIAIHATLTARDFFLAYFYTSGPFTCILSKTSPDFFVPV